IATIRNTGRPSVADEWTIYADLTTGRRVVGTKTFVGNSTLFDNPGPTRVIIPGQDPVAPARQITEDDALYRKALHPIPTGGMIRGYLCAIFAGVSQRELGLPGTKIVVGFKDAWGRSH